MMTLLFIALWVALFMLSMHTDTAFLSIEEDDVSLWTVVVFFGGGLVLLSTLAGKLSPRETLTIYGGLAAIKILQACGLSGLKKLVEFVGRL